MLLVHELQQQQLLQRMRYRRRCPPHLVHHCPCRLGLHLHSCRSDRTLGHVLGLERAGHSRREERKGARKEEGKEGGKESHGAAAATTDDDDAAVATTRLVPNGSTRAWLGAYWPASDCLRSGHASAANGTGPAKTVMIQRINRNTRKHQNLFRI